MSDPGTPRLDWDGIFDQAHRRFFSRLILLVLAAGLGALLLLGSGLSARGAVTLGIGPFGNAKNAKSPTKVDVDPRIAEALRPEPITAPDSTPRGHWVKREKHASVEPWGLTHEAIVDPPLPCPQGSGSAEDEYSDCPPDDTTDGDSARGGTEGPPGTETEISEEVKGALPANPNQSGLADATPEGTSP